MNRLLSFSLFALLLALPAGGVGPSRPGKKGWPPIIGPGSPGRAPSDAVVLFDGKSLDGWQGGAVRWKLVEGQYMEITPRGGTLRTKGRYGYGHYHVEFATPSVVKGRGQGRGNSGVYIMGRNEVQVLDSFDNETYPDGQCGAIYGRHIPLVNASRRPGEWQTFDIIFHPPVVDGKKVVRKGAYTVLHNGVVIHELADVGATNPKDTGPLVLQDHGNPVRFRNIWYRPWRAPIQKKKK
jgi:hypothetical protein